MTGDQTCNPGMCHDPELNMQPKVYPIMLQATKPQGQETLLFKTLLYSRPILVNFKYMHMHIYCKNSYKDS